MASRFGRTVLAALTAPLLLPLAPAPAAPLPALVPSAPPALVPSAQAGATMLPQAKQRLGGIEAPADQALRRKSDGPVAVRLQLRKGARVASVRVNGVDVTDRVKVRRRTATVMLKPAGPMKVGRNGVLVRFVRDGRQSLASSRFTYARSVTGLIRVSAAGKPVRGSHRQAAGPLALRVRVTPKATMAAWLNGQPVTKRFELLADGTRQARLGPSAGLRFGRNTVRVRALTADGRLQERTLVVPVGSKRPLADAGPDRRTDTRHPVRLDGRQSVRTPAAAAVRYAWRITGAPRKKAAARLTGRKTARPTFSARTPGTYVLSNTARSGGATSTDTVTVAVSPSASVQPVTMTVGEDDPGQIVPGIAVGPQFYPTPADGPGVQLLVVERATLAPSDNLAYPAGQMSGLARYLANASTQANASEYMYVLASLPGGPFTTDTADLASLVDAVQFLGFTVPNPSDPLSSIDPMLPFQLVGIPDPYTNGTAWSMPAALAGVFTPDVNGNWTFSTGDYAPFDTGGQAITLGTQSWPVPNGDGFQVVVADPLSLAGSSSLFTMPGQVAQMGQTLQAATAAGQVVAIRSVGTLPDLSQAGSQANANGFTQVTGALQDMGGSPTVFLGLGPGDAYSFVGPTQPYSFPAEASTTIGGDGSVTGQLFRVPQGGGYAPMAADPTGSADFTSSLSSIAVQPAVAWPGSTSAGQRASLVYLSKKLGIGCDVSPCDVRSAYDDLDYQTQWTGLVTQLATYPCSSPSGCQQLKATASQFAGVRRQLGTEFRMVDDVWGMLGTGSGIQSIYAEAQGATVGGLSQALNAVDSAVAPPADPATTTILSLVTDLMWAASIVDVADWAVVATVAGALAVGAASANDLANLPSGSPYQAVADAGPVFTGDILDQLTGTMEGVGLLGQFIVQDWGRLSAAATQIDKAWTIDASTADALSSGLVNGAVQNMYSALMPVAYDAYAFTPPPGTGQTIAQCQPSINPRLPWEDAAPEASYLDQMAPAVTGVEPNEGLAWYAWWEAGKSPKSLFPPYGSPPPGSLLGDLYQPFSSQNTQYAGLNDSWFWGRTYLGAPAPTPTVLKCKYRG